MNGNITEITKLVIKVERNRIIEEGYFCEQKEESIYGLDIKPPSGDREDWCQIKGDEVLRGIKVERLPIG